MLQWMHFLIAFGCVLHKLHDLLELYTTGKVSIKCCVCNPQLAMVVIKPQEVLILSCDVHSPSSSTSSFMIHLDSVMIHWTLYSKMLCKRNFDIHLQHSAWSNVGIRIVSSLNRKTWSTWTQVHSGVCTAVIMQRFPVKWFISKKHQWNTAINKQAKDTSYLTGTHISDRSLGVNVDMRHRIQLHPSAHKPHPFPQTSQCITLDQQLQYWTPSFHHIDISASCDRHSTAVTSITFVFIAYNDNFWSNEQCEYQLIHANSSIKVTHYWNDEHKGMGWTRAIKLRASATKNLEFIFTRTVK